LVGYAWVIFSELNVRFLDVRIRLPRIPPTPTFQHTFTKYSKGQLFKSLSNNIHNPQTIFLAVKLMAQLLGLLLPWIHRWINQIQMSFARNRNNVKNDFKEKRVFLMKNG
jgi:hypothetical protein